MLLKMSSVFEHLKSLHEHELFDSVITLVSSMSFLTEFNFFINYGNF